jgi:hypothetical protein
VKITWSRSNISIFLEIPSNVSATMPDSTAAVRLIKTIKPNKIPMVKSCQCFGGVRWGFLARDGGGRLIYGGKRRLNEKKG